MGGQQKKGPKTDQRVKLLPPEERGRRDEEIELVGRSDGKSRGKSGGKSGGRGRTVVRPRPEPVVGDETVEVFCRGWDYTNKGGATWNMTCAGLSSLILANENLGRLPGDEGKALTKSIRDGYGWVMNSWNPQESFYGMYSLEKVADLGDVKSFGSHEWYADLSSHLVKSQQKDGRWKGTGKHGENDRVATAFALLILKRATSLLTRGAGSRIVLSGKSANNKRDRTWVYVPEFGTSLHYPSVLEVLQKRPSSKLLRLFEDIIKAYPEEWRGELIPPIFRARNSVKSKSVVKVLSGVLEDITGVEYEDPKLYEKWHGRWTRLAAAVEGGKKSDSSSRKKDAERALRYYQDPMDSLVLKKKAAWALLRLKVREAIPVLLEELDSDGAKTRELAYRTLGGFWIDAPPPFSPSGPATKRREQAEAVREWVRRQQSKRR